MRYRTLSGAISLLALIMALGGCKSDSNKLDSNQAESDATASPDEAFTWNDALASSPDEAAQALGAYDGCKPQRSLPSFGPENRQFWLGGMPFCRFEDEPSNPHEAYKISAILYSRGDATLVELKPRSETSVDEVVDKFDLPDFPVERRMRVGEGEHKHNKLSLRPRSFEFEQGELLGVDIFTKPNSPDKVEFVRIPVIAKWYSIVDYAQFLHPSAATDNVVLPATTSPLSPLSSGLYAELGVNTVTISTGPVVPRKQSSAPGSAIEPRTFETAKLSASNGAWVTELTEIHETWQKAQHKLGMETKGLPITIAADRTLPASSVVNFMKAAQRTKTTRFEVLARKVDTLAEPLSAYGEVHKVNLNYAPDYRQAAQRSRLKLALVPTDKGISIWAMRAMLPPQKGCPKDGPTFCLKDANIDIAGEVQKARSLQKEGKFAESQKHLQKALSAYDWVGLYGTLAKIKDSYPNETLLMVKADGSVPLAVVMRAIELARYKRGPGEKCDNSFDTNAALNDAALCKKGKGFNARFVEMFDHAVIIGDYN